MFVNHVNLQGYLEITFVEEVTINSKAIPIIHGILHSGDFLAKHKLLITDYPALSTIEMVRRFQKIRSGQLMAELSDSRVGKTTNNGFPLVFVEGELLSSPEQESVVKVRWIYFMSITSNQIDFKDERLDEIVANIANRWWEMSETERQLVYEYLHGYFYNPPLRS